ncbi:hypothetical protein V2J09_018081 [Rumex salicifolius]
MPKSKIKNQKSDWGGEFRNVSTFLNQNGISHRISCPYTQEQNGAVKRRNRIIIEKCLTLLAQSSLPQEFWEHAFKTATYLHNRTITPTLHYRSPYQQLYNKDPNYGFLKTFGCLCYPFLRPYNNHKIDFRSLPCVFIGYSTSHKGYLCFHKPKERIYVARHVVFNESVFPYSISSINSAHHPPNSTSPGFNSNLLEQAAGMPNPTNTQTEPLSTTNQPTFAGPLPPPTILDSPEWPTTTQTIPTSPINPTHHALPPLTSEAAQPTVPSHYHPAQSSTHSMITRAQTGSLTPKILAATLKPETDPHDLIITGTDSGLVNTFIITLNKVFALKDQGDLHYFLGLQITCTESGVQLTQEGYVRDILESTHMSAAAPITTPAAPQHRLVKAGEPFEDPALYRRTVGSLQYATITRPDITYAVNRVCQYMHSPTIDHWRAVKRILRYLAGTLSHSLHFSPTQATSFLAYSDAGWISNSDDSRSQERERNPKIESTDDEKGNRGDKKWKTERERKTKRDIGANARKIDKVRRTYKNSKNRLAKSLNQKIMEFRAMGSRYI